MAAEGRGEPAARLRILMVTDVFFPRVNGVSTSIATFRGALHAQGHRITLVAPGYGAEYPDDEDIVRIPGRRVPTDPEDRLMHGRRLREGLDDLRDMAFHVVHIQTPFLAHYAGTRFARELGIPCVETCHTLPEPYLRQHAPLLPARVARWLAPAIARRQSRAVDRLIVPSGAVQEQLERCGVTTPMRVVPTGLTARDFDVPDRTGFVLRRGLEVERPTIVHVGRMSHEKNIGFLVDALHRIRQRIPNVLMILAGEGPARDGVRRRVVDLGLAGNVRFLGHLSRNGELQACYACADVFVFASRTETQGLAVLEAMAAGTPVVSTAVMGTRDTLAAGRGALVAEEDVDDFSDKVVRVLWDESLRRRLGDEGRRFAAEWKAERFAADLAGVYAELARR